MQIAENQVANNITDNNQEAAGSATSRNLPEHAS